MGVVLNAGFTNLFVNVSFKCNLKHDKSLSHVQDHFGLGYQEFFFWCAHKSKRDVSRRHNY